MPSKPAARKLDPYTLRYVARSLWRYGRAQQRDNAYSYAQGIFASSRRCLQKAEALESRTTGKGER